MSFPTTNDLARTTLIAKRLNRWKRSLDRRWRRRTFATEGAGKYRRILQVAAGSFVVTLLLVTAINRLAAQRDKISPLEIDRLEDSRRHLAQSSSPVQPSSPLAQPFSETVKPVDLTIVKMYPAAKTGLPELRSAAPPAIKPRAFVYPSLTFRQATRGLEASGLERKVEAPAPDVVAMAGIAADPLNASVSELPAPPPLVAKEPEAATRTGSSTGLAPAEAKAVIATLQRYSQAWSSRHVAEIAALRPTLSRRVVEQDLAGARSITMRIQPVSVPRIQGDRATVECLHQVDQVFVDGVERQSPGVKMTYVLVKRGTGWLIQESR